MKIGHGYDIHRFGSQKPLMLGCARFEYPEGLIAHSDGDVVCHALCDALLGAAGLPDIGVQFPDNDARYEGVSGSALLAKTNDLIRLKGYRLSCADITVIAEKPKIAPHYAVMRESIAKALGTDKDNINVKATTEEGLGIAGKGVACHAVCILEEEKP